MSWDAGVIGGYEGERIRVEVSSSGVDVIFYLPNPHAGYEGGTHFTLEDFLGDAPTHATIKTHCGDEAFAEVVAEVRRLTAERSSNAGKA